jgi:site-specific recombinase XerD
MNKKEFTAYLESKNLVKATITRHILYVEFFLTTTKKEDIQITKADVLKFLERLKNNRKISNKSRAKYLKSLNHYFTFLCENEQITQNPCMFLKIRGTNKLKLYKIYTPEELTQLADNFYHVFISGFDDSYLQTKQKQKSFLSRHRNYTMLTFLLFQGLITTELTQIKLNDIDLNKARLILNNGKTTRTLPIQASQMGALIYYINNIRPQFLDYCKGETDKLFFALSAEQYDKTFIAPLKELTKHVKSIDRNFINFVQIRTSVITHWIQTEGLRKAQYLAGHKHIISTEKYLPNDLNSLMNDVQKFNPF